LESEQEPIDAILLLADKMGVPMVQTETAGASRSSCAKENETPSIRMREKIGGIDRLYMCLSSQKQHRHIEEDGCIHTPHSGSNEVWQTRFKLFSLRDKKLLRQELNWNDPA
jgi:hypothetical protein